MNSPHTRSKEVTTTKKVVLLTTIIFFAAGLAYAGSAVRPITQDDLKDLKGAWTGERIGHRGRAERVDVLISTRSLPLQGEVTLYWEKRNVTPKTWPCTGHIEDGRLIVLWAKDNRKMELELRTGDGEMKLEGHITDKGFRGTVFLKKIQE